MGLKILAKSLFKQIAKTLLLLMHSLKLDNNKIVFSSFSARSYSDNPKAILEALLSRGKVFDCVVVLRNPKKAVLPKGVRAVKFNSISYLYEMATAKFWVDNTRKQSFMIKRKNQIYIQTWHGCPWLKGIEKDVEESLDKEYIKCAIHDSSLIDYLITNSDWGVENFKRCFWYSNKIIKIGTPRLDTLFRHELENIDYLRKQLGLNYNVKYVLYAPTFRKHDSLDAYNIDFNTLVSSLKLKFGGEWGVIVKLHPNISHLKFKQAEFVAFVDATNYPEIVDIFKVVDVLITDYSSVMFDFSYTLKPIFLYTNDLSEYEKDRSIMFKMSELPFPIVLSNDQLKNVILSYDYNQYITRLEEFNRRLSVLEDGKASDRIARLIEDLASL